MIDVMEKHGLLVRKNDYNDRRAYKIYLTNSGRQLKERLPEIVASHIEKACRGIGKKELEVTLETLAKIRRNFESSGD
jgi:DNA-binding MarR family transcriptional regulator